MIARPTPSAHGRRRRFAKLSEDKARRRGPPHSPSTACVTGLPPRRAPRGFPWARFAFCVLRVFVLEHTPLSKTKK